MDCQAEILIACRVFDVLASTAGLGQAELIVYLVRR